MPHDLGNDVVIVQETDKAYLLRFGDDDNRQEVWVPKSVITHQNVYSKGETGSFEIQTWWAEREGIA